VHEYVKSLPAELRPALRRWVLVNRNREEVTSLPLVSAYLTLLYLVIWTWISLLSQSNTCICKRCNEYCFVSNGCCVQYLPRLIICVMSNLNKRISSVFGEPLKLEDQNRELRTKLRWGNKFQLIRAINLNCFRMVFFCAHVFDGCFLVRVWLKVVWAIEVIASFWAIATGSGNL
jgi:hypothetical protein